MDQRSGVQRRCKGASHASALGLQSELIYCTFVFTAIREEDRCINPFLSWKKLVFAQSDEVTSVELKLWLCEHTTNVLSSFLKPCKVGAVTLPALRWRTRSLETLLPCRTSHRRQGSELEFQRLSLCLQSPNALLLPLDTSYDKPLQGTCMFSAECWHVGVMNKELMSE